MKKRNIRIVCGSLVTLLLLSCSLIFLANFMEPKQSRIKLRDFYEQEQNFDVLFLGTSHVEVGISPMDMWEQNGIVGYNLATPTSSIATSYWSLRNALQYTKPKLVVLDCAYLLDEKVANISYMHNVFDVMPLSKVKIEALLDLFGWGDDFLRLMFPFSIYHNRWNEMTRGDIIVDYSSAMMGWYQIAVVQDGTIPSLMSDTAETVDNISTDYLNKIVELCEKEGIALLLTYIPFQSEPVYQNDAAYIRIFAEENGLNYLDPVQLMELLNHKIDFCDNLLNNSHVNISGSHKLSYFLGDYIKDNYDIPDRRQDPAYHAWNDYYEAYSDYKLSLIEKAHNPINYLVATSDPNYTVMVQITDKKVTEDEIIMELIHSLDIPWESTEDSVGVLLSNDTSGETADYTFAWSNDETPECLHDGEVIYSWGDVAANAEIFVLVLDKEDMSVLHGAAFATGDWVKVS